MALPKGDSLEEYIQSTAQRLSIMLRIAWINEEAGAYTTADGELVFIVIARGEAAKELLKAHNARPMPDGSRREVADGLDDLLS